MTCKTCKFLDVRPDKSGRRGVRKGFTYRCLWEMPELVLADSITRYVSFPPRTSRGATWEARTGSTARCRNHGRDAAALAADVALDPGRLRVGSPRSSAKASNTTSPTA